MSPHGEDFETLLQELEGIVESLESEELELDAALRLFERGVERLRLAAERLDAAHGRVEELIQGDEGQTLVVDLDLVDGEDGGANGG